METKKPDMRPSNRRTAARKALRCPGVVQLPREGAREVTLHDVSLQGLSVTTSRPIAPGTRCSISFELPLAAGPCPLTLKTRVVYSSYTAPHAFQVGMVYGELDPADEAAIETFTHD